jgi:WD40 repeat protein
MKVGALFAVEFSQDDKFVLAGAGAKGVLAIWDTSENDDVERIFDGRCSVDAA